jgi:PAS domain S-box-containing protein
LRGREAQYDFVHLACELQSRCLAERIPWSEEGDAAALGFAMVGRCAIAMGNIKGMREVLFEVAPDAMVVLGPRWVVDANAAARTLFGALDEGLSGRSLLDLSWPSQLDDAPVHVIERRLGAAQAGSPQDFEWFFRRIDGHPFAARASLRSLPPPWGMERFVLLSVRAGGLWLRHAQAVRMEPQDPPGDVEDAPTSGAPTMRIPESPRD